MEKYSVETIFKIFEALHKYLGSPINNLDDFTYYPNKVKKKKLYIEKFGILIFKIGDLVVLTNVRREFEISLKNIKIMELFDEKKKKLHTIWTCSSTFSQYYFEKYINGRICIKKKDKYISIDTAKHFYRENRYYLIPYKTDFKQMKEIFPDLPKSFKIRKIDFEINLKNENKIFFYHSQIGLTYYLLNYLISLRLETNTRILYLNSYFLLKSNCRKSERRNYILYFIQMLFFNDEYEKKNNFIIELEKNFPENNILTNVIQKVIDYFKKDNNNMFIVFDNIYSTEDYQTINEIKSNILYENKKVYFHDFLRLNCWTFSLFQTFMEKKKYFEFINIKNINKVKPIEKVWEYIEYCKNKVLYNYEYLINKSKEINKVSSDNYVDNYCKLIKIIYCANVENLGNINQNELIKDIETYIDYIYLNIENLKII